MIVNSLNNRQQNSFKGLKVGNFRSKLNGIQQDIQVFQIDKHDKDFLKLLQNNIYFEERMPGLSKPEYERWHEMLELASDEALKPSNSAYVAAVDNKACGIISFKPGKKNFTLECICTWPVKAGEKVKLAGKSLFYQLFRVFNQDKANKIKLYAITNGPYDTISKYKRLGFREISAEPHKVLMETNKYNVKNTMNNLEQILEYIPENNPKKVKLSEVLDI